MILLIDNYDSFTYNLARYIKLATQQELVIIKNDQLNLSQIIKLKPAYIIISPGPGSPLNSGVTIDCINYFKNLIPILGICLGHQCIANYYGATITQAREILHGKTSIIQHNNDPIFINTPETFNVTRYHSLSIKSDSLPNELQVIATSNNEIMAIKHKTNPIYGFQFHPEAHLSEHGQQLITNFFRLT